MKQRVVIEWGSDGTYSAYAPDMQNAPIGMGKTAEEARLDFLNTVQEMREFFIDEGKTVPLFLCAQRFFRVHAATLTSKPFASRLNPERHRSVTEKCLKSLRVSRQKNNEEARLQIV